MVQTVHICDSRLEAAVLVGYRVSSDSYTGSRQRGVVGIWDGAVFGASYLSADIKLQANLYDCVEASALA